MSLESIPCNNCGAPLDVAPSARFVTCRSCGASLTVQRTDTSVWTETSAVGYAPEGRIDRLEDNVQHLNVRSELEMLDSQWEREREEYMTTNKYGVKSLPNRNASVLMGVVAGGFGLLWTIMAMSMTAHSQQAFANAPPGFGPPPILEYVFPLFGVLFIAFGIGMAIYGYQQAEKYEQAKARYEKKRAAIEAKLRR